MRVAGEDVASMVALFHQVVAARPRLVAAGRGVVADHLRAMEDVSAGGLAGAEQATAGVDLDVRDLERGWHPRAERQDTTEGVPGLTELQMLRQVHEATALGVDGSSGSRQLADRLSRGLVAGKLGGVQLRVATPDVEAVETVRNWFPQRRELDELRPGLLEQFEV